MKRITYNTVGTCSKQIMLEVDDDNRIADIRIIGGCSGNVQGLCALVKGMTTDEVHKRLNGIHCGSRSTSCPDQLCRALESI